jgi:hypothetical protein
MNGTSHGSIPQGRGKFEADRHAVSLFTFCYSKTLPCPSPATVKYQSKKNTKKLHTLLSRILKLRKIKKKKKRTCCTLQVTTDNNASFLVDLIHFCDAIKRGRVKEKSRKRKVTLGKKKRNQKVSLQRVVSLSTILDHPSAPTLVQENSSSL